MRLCMSIRLLPSATRALLLVGGMDKWHRLLDVASQSVLHVFRDHAKYVVRVRWHPSGDMFATASYDHEVILYRYVSSADILVRLR